MLGLYAWARAARHISGGKAIAVALAPRLFFGGWCWPPCALLCQHSGSGTLLVQVTNVSGAAGDLYITWKALRMPAGVLIQDTGAEMAFYTCMRPAENRAAGGFLFFSVPCAAGHSGNFPFLREKRAKVLTSPAFFYIITHAPFLVAYIWRYSSQLARAFGSYTRSVTGSNPVTATTSQGFAERLGPRAAEVACRQSRSAFSKTLAIGPLVKRSRHRPFTAVTRVRFP